MQEVPHQPVPAPAVPENSSRLTRAERRARDAAAQIQRAQLLDDEKRRRRLQDEKDAAERAERREQAKLRRDTTKSIRSNTSRTKWQARLKSWRDTLILVGAIVGVNLVAIVGQVTAFHAGFRWPLLGAFGAAAVIESIAIYVGWHAHTALIEGDSVARLRAASYGIAVVVAGLNYHHYAPDWLPTDKAVMFGMASLLSPWLWAIHSRHQHRSQLRTAGLIDPRAPKFSALRWILHRAETWQALKWAVRFGEQSPTAAILAIQTDDTTTESVHLLDRTRAELMVGQTALIRAQADAIAATEMCVAELEKALAEVSSHRTEDDRDDEASDDHQDDDEPDSDDDADGEQESDRERPDDQDNRVAEKWIRGCMRAGRTPRQRDIAAKYGFSNGWAALRVKAARAELSAKGYRFLPGNVVQSPTELATVNGSQSVHADAISMTAVEVS
ncbi:hypothetical protein AB0J63_26395 [Streptosporangium canum]|uniref:hypothetical protein n=1 Tax=Streptosporangium canum TaxID=324952 RepID=UPI00343DB505